MVGIQIAFKKFQAALGIWGSPWVGLYQFERFFSLPNFKNLIINTVSITVYRLVAGFPLPIILALIINAFPYKKTKKLIQTISYMPYFISVVVVVGMLKMLLHSRLGVVGVIYYRIFGEYMSDIFAYSSVFPHLFVWSGIWQGLGWGTIIYIAALSSVDMELHEAAEIDGASRLQRIRHIDFPSILPTTIILLILSFGDIMSLGFEKVYLMQNQMNIARSEVISTYVYKVSLTRGVGDFSFGTAIGLFNTVINFILLIIVNFIAKKVVDYSLF